MAEHTTAVTLLCSDCPVSSVTVYSDRAEVVRTLTVVDAQPGTYEVTLRGLTRQVDPNSLHVSGGQGHAVILEVSCSDADDDDASAAERSARAAELAEQLREAKQRQRELNVELDVANGLRVWTEGLADNVKLTPQVEARGPDFLSAGYLEKLSSFSAFYSAQMARIGGQMAELRCRLAEASERVTALAREIAVCTGAASSDPPFGAPRATRASKNVTVAFTATAAGSVALQLAYVVCAAGWSASYDCRVETAGARAQLTYYGVVANLSGDSWDDASVFLSTASPSVGGEPPKLRTCAASFVSPAPVCCCPPGGFVPGAACSTGLLFGSAAQVGAAPGDYTELAGGSATLGPAPAVAVLATTASESIVSATFEVPRKATIASDGREHKLTIAVVPLAMEFSHEVAPGASQWAFLKATTTNASAFPLLASEQCSVFIDGNFVATTSIGNTNVGEQFSVYLGADKAVKVDYKKPAPVKDQSGMLIKSSIDRYSGMITVKNTKQCEISVTVHEQLPRSSNAEIKITAVEPDLRSANSNTPQERAAARLDESHNIEWRARVAPSKEMAFPVKFTVEYPKDKTVRFQDL
eukprot:m51a1_g11373 hypothetical protein (584) ;mRNA; f:18980-20916